MTDRSSVSIGAHVSDAAGRRIGTVDAVFVDYLLVRTTGRLPVDLYVPVTEVQPAADEASLVVSAEDAAAAYVQWHRPLKRAPHN
jgi:hypothetical protein